MLYHAPPGATDPNAPYVGKNVAAAQQGSRVPPKAVEYTQREIVAAVSAAGLTPTDLDLTQLAQAIGTGIFVGAFGGTANALTASLPTGAAFGSLLPGLRIIGVVGAAANTGAVTLDLQGFITSPGPKAAKRRAGTTDLAAGDLAAGALVAFRYYGGLWRHEGLTLSDVNGVSLSTTQVTSVVTQILANARNSIFQTTGSAGNFGSNNSNSVVTFTDASSTDLTNNGASGFTVNTTGIYAITGFVTITIGVSGAAFLSTSLNLSVNGGIVTGRGGYQSGSVGGTGNWPLSPNFTWIGVLNAGDVIVPVAGQGATAYWGNAHWSAPYMSALKMIG